MQGSLALVAVGYVIDRLDIVIHVVHHQGGGVDQTGDRAIAMVLVLSGLGLGVGAFVRFLTARRMIDSEQFNPRPLMDLMLFVVAAIDGFVIMAYLAKVGG